MDGELRSALGPQTSRKIDLMLERYQGAYADPIDFIWRAVQAYCRQSRPDYIGSPPRSVPADAPWPPDPEDEWWKANAVWPEEGEMIAAIDPIQQSDERRRRAQSAGRDRDPGRAAGADAERVTGILAETVGCDSRGV